MLALRSHFDGRQIITPEELRAQKPCDVIVVVLDSNDEAAGVGWQMLHGDALQNTWDNDEDRVYDSL
jgi:hypothetical protein